ncbi:hypothetical protein SAMN05216570_3165 [Dyella sp. OK004]|uniref:hypothetical protein n=1 Tax=Dyella sp. OK004 TaxID=1855292 RepID=UPI0008F03C3B|nr:hypothetical protein [Dyella sp. OK004]SFS14834.1 hypothetical protein SAMN05216570_3165 [Dyella sp. OK004]
MKRNVLLPVFFAVFALVLSGCHREPDEQRIRQAISAAAQGAGQVDAGALAGVLTEDFDGNAGSMSRKDLGNLLLVAKLRGETVHVVMGPVAIEPRGDRYVARFTVTLGSGGKLFPAELGMFNVETAWRREGRDWRCYTATWTQSL